MNFNRSIVLILLIWVSAQAGPGHRHGPDQLDVVLRIQLPAQVPADALLHWSYVVDGRVVASDEKRLDALPNSFELEACVQKKKGLLHLTINSDELVSPYPSVGDWYQQIPITLQGDPPITDVPGVGWQKLEIPAEAILTVHYHRFDKAEQNAGLWTWDEAHQRMPADQEVHPVGYDSFGAVFQIDIRRYGSDQEGIGLLPRLFANWSFKDAPDRIWRRSMSKTIFVVQDDPVMYESKPDLSPALIGASLEAEREMLLHIRYANDATLDQVKNLQLTVDRPRMGDSPDSSTNHEVIQPTKVTAVAEQAGKATYRVELSGRPSFESLSYTVKANGLGEARLRPGAILLDRSLYFDGEVVLGADYSSHQTTFRVFAPTASRVVVAISDKHRPKADDGAIKEYAMMRGEKGIWSATVEGDWHGFYYAYRLEGPGLDAGRYVADIYAKCMSGPSGWGMVVDLARTNPAGFDPRAYVPLASPVDAVIYEMHVRDFTISLTSGVALEHRGRFLGMVEGGTHLPGEASVVTGIDHLVELGVTHVQLLPIQDFNNTERYEGPYDWGYMPVNFFSPDGWYASQVVGTERIREFKQLVQAMHDRGIGVVMDVVYNHAHEDSGFEQLVPGYYFRRKPDGSLWNGSGCGNELASEHPMARKFMLDSLKYWTKEYGIDGYRFDLMGLHDLETMLLVRDELKKINPSVFVYGEPWAAGESGLQTITNQQRVAGTGIAAFNDHIRDGIKGERDGGPPGFIQAGERANDVKKGIMAAIDDWTREPIECITYCEAHDNLTTWDKLIQSVPHGDDDTLARMQRLAGLIVLTSQGIPFLHAGQEMCRTKQGNHNSYNAPDEINRIDWTRKQQFRQVYDYYRGLIALRKAHPALRIRSAKDLRARMSFFKNMPNAKTIGYQIDSKGLAGETATQIVVLLNGDSQGHTFTLPEGTWNVVVDGDQAGMETLRTVTTAVAIPPHAGAVLTK